MIGMFAQFLFLAYWFQLVAGYSPLTSGFAFLPHIAGLIIGTTQIATRLSGRVPVRRIMVPGLLVAALGMLLLTQLTVDSSYWALVMPATVLLGVGMGAAFMPAMTLATSGIRPQDAGVASARALSHPSSVRSTTAVASLASRAPAEGLPRFRKGGRRHAP